MHAGNGKQTCFFVWPKGQMCKQYCVRGGFMAFSCGNADGRVVKKSLI